MCFQKEVCNPVQLVTFCAESGIEEVFRLKVLFVRGVEEAENVFSPMRTIFSGMVGEE